MHWVTTNGGKTFHARRPKMILSGIKMHPHLPDCILASRLNDRCLGTSQAPARPSPPRPAPCSAHLHVSRRRSLGADEGGTRARRGAGDAGGGAREARE